MEIADDVEATCQGIDAKSAHGILDISGQGIDPHPNMREVAAIVANRRSVLEIGSATDDGQGLLCRKSQ